MAVKVEGKAASTTVDLNKTSVTVMTGAAVTVKESIEAKIKDQYNEDMVIKSAVVEKLATPENTAVVPAFSEANGKVVLPTDRKKATINITGADFNGAKTGTYTYKITLKGSDDKELVRTFTVNYVKNDTVQAYQLSVNSEKDTTVKADTANATGYDFNIKVVEMANGAAIGDYAAGTDKSAVEYIVKDKDGKTIAQMGGATTVTCAAIADISALTGDQLTVKPVSVKADGVSYKKELAAGTYYVTAKFTVGSGVNAKDVAVSGSFTIKDSQDTSANINVKKNDVAASVTAALQNQTLVEVTYDGVKQTINASDIVKVDGTIAGNTAYVKSVDIYVALTDEKSAGVHNKVLITVPVNQTFTNVSAL